jgi:superoxide dismutase, Cu-Zn family
MEDDVQVREDNGGAAIEIYAKEDDYKTDPAGNSGPRIACGIVQRLQDR